MNIGEQVYSVEKLKDFKYFNLIKNTINTFKDTIPYDLSKNEQKLRDIITENIIPEPIYKEFEIEINGLLEILKVEKDFSKRTNFKDEILSKSLSISSKQFEKAKKKMKDAGRVIREVEISKFERVYIFPCEYSFEKGLEFKESYNSFEESQFI